MSPSLSLAKGDVFKTFSVWKRTQENGRLGAGATEETQRPDLLSARIQSYGFGDPPQEPKVGGRDDQLED